MSRGTSVCTRIFCIVFAGVVVAAQAHAQAQPQPFAAGDAKKGKVLVERDCTECHARRFEGDAAKMYLRPDRKVRTPTQLLTQVGVCNNQLQMRYFPEEEEHVAAYLNLHYYKFEP